MSVTFMAGVLGDRNSYGYLTSPGYDWNKPRYSEDGDVLQVNEWELNVTGSNARDILSYLGMEVRIDDDGNADIFDVDSLISRIENALSLIRVESSLDCGSEPQTFAGEQGPIFTSRGRRAGYLKSVLTRLLVIARAARAANGIVYAC
jgi:hypothetical protein